MLDDLSNEEGELWVAISLAIWCALNKLHNDIQLHPKQILAMGSSLVRVFKEVCVLKSRTIRPM